VSGYGGSTCDFKHRTFDVLVPRALTQLEFFFMRVSPTPGRKLKDIYRYVFGGKRDYLRDFVVEELPSSGVVGGIQNHA